MNNDKIIADMDAKSIIQNIINLTKKTIAGVAHDISIAIGCTERSIYYWFNGNNPNRNTLDRLKNYYKNLIPNSIPKPSSNKLTDIQQNIISMIKKGSISVRDISEGLDKSEKTIVGEIGILKNIHKYEIEIDEYTERAHITDISSIKPQAIDLVINHKGQMKFFVWADLHTGSRYQQYSILKTAYNIAEKEKVDIGFAGGDITDGYKVYGEKHIHERFLIGADEQEEYAEKNIPVGNFPTYMCPGNHDMDFWGRFGYNIIKSLCSKRKDFIYVENHSTITINGITFMMRHSKGGCSYARSYKPQKITDSVMKQALKEKAWKELKSDLVNMGKTNISETGTKGIIPNVIFYPHWHSVLYQQEGFTDVFMVPCLQSQTPHLKDLGLSPDVGFYIITIDINSNDSVDKINFDYYKMNRYVKENDF